MRGRSVSSFLSYLAAVTALFVCLLSACSVPNLEKPECTAARDTVKRFYSFHFDNAGHASDQVMPERLAFITPRLAGEIASANWAGRDYFTQTEEFPKAFRVGACNAAGDTATLEVVLLWRDDKASRQEEIKVGTVRSGDNWLIDKVTK